MQYDQHLKKNAAARNLFASHDELRLADPLPGLTTQEIDTMNRRLATRTLAGAIGLAAAGSLFAVQAQQMDPKAQTMQRMQQEKLAKCYGIAARAKNDCAEGAHSCAGQATKDRDLGSFVLLPAGACDKIAGGKATAA